LNSKSVVSSTYALSELPITPPIISHELQSAVTTSLSPYALDITTGNIYVDAALLLSAYNQQESRSVCIYPPIPTHSTVVANITPSASATDWESVVIVFFIS